LSENLFGHPIFLHSLQLTQPTYPLPLYPFYYIFSFTNSSSSRLGNKTSMTKKFILLAFIVRKEKRFNFQFFLHFCVYCSTALAICQAGKCP
jgi:hypothetical protein